MKRNNNACFLCIYYYGFFSYKVRLGLLAIQDFAVPFVCYEKPFIIIFDLLPLNLSKERK